MTEADKKKCHPTSLQPTYSSSWEQNMPTFLRNTTFNFSVLISGFANSVEARRFPLITFSREAAKLALTSDLTLKVSNFYSKLNFLIRVMLNKKYLLLDLAGRMGRKRKEHVDYYGTERIALGF